MHQIGRAIGVFHWSLAFDWDQIPERTLKKINHSLTEPYPSPTMAGGLLAVDRKYFFEMGGYDDGMESTIPIRVLSFSNYICCSLFHSGTDKFGVERTWKFLSGYLPFCFLALTFSSPSSQVYIQCSYYNHD